MSVSTATAKKTYNGDGATVNFPTTFPFFVAGDIVLTERVIATGAETLKVLTTDYTVTGGGSPVPANGTVVANSAPPSTVQWVLTRSLPGTQLVVYTPNDPFPAKTHEGALDRLTLDAADRQELTDRSLKLPVSAPSTISVELPDPTALKTFRWNAALTALEETDDPAVSATAAAASAAAASTSETNAAASASGAAGSATNAATSETNAATSASNAGTSETNASTSETNAAASAVTADSAAQAVAERYDFDGSIVMADPGSGDIRYNNASVSAVTQIAIAANTAAAGAPDISARIITWDDSTNSTLRGTLVIRKGGTPATFAVFDITGAITDNGTWLQIPVAHVASAGAWSAADDMYVEFTRTGDQGGIANPMSAVLNTGGFAIDFSEGANVASAASPDIWVTGGNTLHLTGSATVTGFAAAPRIGAWRWLIIDAAPLFTDGANLIVEGNDDFQAAAGDLALVYAETLTQFRMWFKKADGTAVASAGSNAACQLGKSGANLLLSRHDGTTINIDGTLETIPSGGVTLAATGATPGTLYFIYVFMSGSTMTLERQTGGHSTDIATGMEIRTGDSTRTLVGMARPITGPAWQDTEGQRFVRSWFHDEGVAMAGSNITGETSTSASLVEMGTTHRIEGLFWAGEPILIHLSGNSQHSVAGALQIHGIGHDSNTEVGFATVIEATNADERSAINSVANINNVSEGFHDFRPLGARGASGTLTFNASALGGIANGRG